MASDSAIENALQKAQRIGFGSVETVIMWVVLCWMNRKTFDVGGQSLRIDRDYEPSLQELVEATGQEWSDEFEAAHKRMRDSGVFKTRQNDDQPYCAGRYCKWMPTENFLEVARTVFDEFESAYPFWHRAWRSGAPIFGDGNELLNHRKGVLVAWHTLSDLPWISKAELYPEESGVKADLITHRDDVHGVNGRVEVLTGNNDSDRWVNKWEAWATTDIPTVWVFKNRTAMVDFFNTIIGHDDLVNTDAALILDGGTFTGNPNNWSASKVNDRLKQSRKSDGYYVPTHDLVCTLPSLLEADTDTVQEWCQKYRVFPENRGGEYWVVTSGATNN